MGQRDLSGVVCLFDCLVSPITITQQSVSVSISVQSCPEVHNTDPNNDSLAHCGSVLSQL